MTTSKIATAFKTATFALAAGAVALGLASPADAAAGTMYGDPAAAAKYWRQQTYDDCVLMSAADVIGQVTGREPSERAIIKVAQSTPSVVHPGSIYTKPADAEHPNSGMGTSVADIPTLLAHYGVDAVITDEDHATATGVATGMAALEQYLGSGHAVIVSINAEMIWGQPVEETDSAGNPRSDHAVVVTGVDTENGIVHLNDSGTPTGRDEQIPMETFVEAWATSHDVAFPTADKARAFVQTSADKWKNCAGKTVTVTNKAKTYRWTFADVKGSPPTITVIDTQEGAEGWECQRAMSVANNVVVDVNACGYQITNQAGQIAAKIVDKVNKE